MVSSDKIISNLPLGQLVFTTNWFDREVQLLRLPLEPLLQGLEADGLQDVSLQHLGVGGQEVLQILPRHGP